MKEKIADLQRQKDNLKEMMIQAEQIGCGLRIENSFKINMVK